ncbi:Dolichyl N-acetyl-alpha-D-glucosaminyl phosphate 3-beta-D-2,3-diacetamido-2,3-dideoxy-beta-D-glucuronosyltransferase [uncultured archaeon]|nr:Dolichyl N-acetyl-alpha-D-glucosaminyl phosphate 3-beta-D-2,3-diacetamido-2,3-dideoxy-beta-D-glucuronosyltransferase [uncultured archaeon]
MREKAVSIVVPLKAPNKNLEECLEHCLMLDYTDYEILVLPDEPARLDCPKTRVIPSGVLGPSDKRDLALNYARGEILAFIDDDAYPARDWLRNASKYFDDPEVAAVGGPAVTPDDDSFMQKASGYVLSSFLGGGSYTFRYIPGEVREVDDYPTCNLLVRKSIMERLGGFDNRFWPGEDTILCLEITKKEGKKIIYAPDVLVYHHRRTLFRQHLRQIWSYAVHRGYFVKKFPETSLRLSYFLPSLFVVGVVAGLGLSLKYELIRFIYLPILVAYLLAALATGLKTRDIRMAVTVAAGIAVTHIYYGTGFILGLMTSKLER